MIAIKWNSVVRVENREISFEDPQKTDYDSAVVPEIEAKRTGLR